MITLRQLQRLKPSEIVRSRYLYRTISIFINLVVLSYISYSPEPSLQSDSYEDQLEEITATANTVIAFTVLGTIMNLAFMYLYYTIDGSQQPYVIDVGAANWDGLKMEVTFDGFFFMLFVFLGIYGQQFGVCQYYANGSDNASLVSWCDHKLTGLKTTIASGVFHLLLAVLDYKVMKMPPVLFKVQDDDPEGDVQRYAQL